MLRYYIILSLQKYRSGDGHLQHMGQANCNMVKGGVTHSDKKPLF
jgi:hypothetical protein